MLVFGPLGGQSLGGAQARAAGPWVGGELGGPRRQAFRRDEPKPRGAAADADWSDGRAGAATPFGLQEALDHAVLERGVAEDDEPAAGPEQVDGGCEAGFERLELLVDRDPESLERARRWMDPAATGGTPRRDPLDERGQLLRGPDRARASLLDDRARDPAREGFLAVPAEERRQPGRVEAVEKLRRRYPPAVIKAHVERPARPKAEAAFAVSQLVRRQAEVEQRAVDLPEARRRRNRREVA